MLHHVLQCVLYAVKQPVLPLRIESHFVLWVALGVAAGVLEGVVDKVLEGYFINIVGIRCGVYCWGLVAVDLVEDRLADHLDHWDVLEAEDHGAVLQTLMVHVQLHIKHRRGSLRRN